MSDNDNNHDHGHGHVHGPNCGHDHAHDHGHDHSGAAPGVDIANAIIDMANTRMQAGLAPEEIASGIRHAAGNFSAFAFFASGAEQQKLDGIVEEFIRFLEYYLDRHQPAEPAATGLKSLIEKAKGEL